MANKNRRQKYNTHIRRRTKSTRIIRQNTQCQPEDEYTTPNLKTNTEHYIQKTNTQFPKSGDGQKMHAKI